MQRSFSGDISTGWGKFPTGCCSFGSFNDALSRAPNPHTVAKHSSLSADTEHACATRARMSAPGDPSVSPVPKYLDFLPGPDGYVATNIFLSSLSLSPRSDLDVSRENNMSTAGTVGSELRECAACKHKTARLQKTFPVHCFVPGKGSSQPKNTYKMYACGNPACLADTSTCPNFDYHGDLQWVWKEDTKSPARSRSGRWQMKCNKCIELRKAASASRKGGGKAEGANKSKLQTHNCIRNTQLVGDEDLVKELLRRNAFRHLSINLQSQIIMQMGAGSSKALGCSNLPCEWTRCNYCHALYKHHSGTRNRRTREKCILFKFMANLVSTGNRPMPSVKVKDRS